MSFLATTYTNISALSVRTASSYRSLSILDKIRRRRENEMSELQTLGPKRDVLSAHTLYWVGAYISGGY